MPLTRCSAGEAGPNYSKGLLARLCIALLIVAPVPYAAAQVSAGLAGWRADVASARVLAENDATAAYERALQLDREEPSDADSADRALILNVLGRTELYLGRTEAADRHSRAALDLARQDSNRVGQIEALLTISLIDVNEARLDDLVSVLTRSMALLDGVQRPDLVTETLLRTALMYRRFEQFDDAVVLSMQAMDVAQRSRDPLSLTYAYQALGISFGQSGREAEARSNFQKMLEQAGRAHSKLLEADALIQLSGPVGKGVDAREAESLTRQAIELYGQVGAPFNLNIGRITLANILREQGRRVESKLLLDQAIALYGEYPNRIGLWYALNERSTSYQQQHDLAAARADADLAYMIAQQIGFPLYLSESSRRLAAIASAAGDYRSAYDLSTAAADLTARAASDKLSARVEQLAERYKSESRQREIDKLTRSNREQLQRLESHALQQRWLWTLLVGCVAVLAVTSYFLARLRRSHRLLEEVHARLQHSQDDLRVVNATLEQRVQARTAELRQQTLYLRTLIDTLPMWVWLKDTNSRYLACNRAHATAFGRKVDEIVGKTDRDLWPEEIAEIYQADDVEIMASRQRKSRERFVTTATGKHWRETYKTPVLDDDGSVLGIVGASGDISERKAAEAAREEALREAQRLAAMRSEFLAQMSHELRTPLNGILGYADLLSRDASLTDQQRARLGVIKHSGEHLLTLINDILDLARIEAGRLDLSPATVRLDDFLRTLGNIVSVRAEAKELDFLVDLAPELPRGVHADEKRLRQVLLNLLDNAIKFTDRGCVRLIVMAPRSDTLRFEVHDTGTGIPAEHLEAIFKPFEQAPDSRHRASGAGLGLAISRQIVRRMGSEIHVESQLGVGSTFSIELQLPFVDLGPLESESAGVVTGYAGGRRRILVVDDVVDNRGLLVDTLGEIGFEVLAASSGAEGLECARALCPDLIITDIVMPDMSGLELIRCLRSLPSFERIPILAVSASASEQVQYESLKQGATAFLSKPLELERLLAVVGPLLHLSWIREPPRERLAHDGPAHSGRPQIRAAEPLVGPSQQAMLDLRELALQGSMRDILLWASRLIEIDSARYGPFAGHVRRLAETYQSQAILRFVESRLKEDDELATSQATLNTRR